MNEIYPRISIILLRRSNSEAPGNNGTPKNNSATIQPRDHMSMAVVYLNVRSRTNKPTSMSFIKKHDYMIDRWHEA